MTWFNKPEPFLETIKTLSELELRALLQDARKYNDQEAFNQVLAELQLRTPTTKKSRNPNLA